MGCAWDAPTAFPLLLCVALEVAMQEMGCVSEYINFDRSVNRYRTNEIVIGGEVFPGCVTKNGYGQGSVLSCKKVLLGVDLMIKMAFRRVADARVVASAKMRLLWADDMYQVSHHGVAPIYCIKWRVAGRRPLRVTSDTLHG